MSDHLPNPNQLRINRLKTQLQECQAAYEREKSRIGGVSGGAERELESELERYEEQIERFTQEIQAAEQTLAGDRIKTLAGYLSNGFDSHRDLMIKAYRQSLPSSSWALQEAMPDTVQGLITRLANSGKEGVSPYPPLIHFVAKLLRQCEQLYIPSLREWLEAEIDQLSTLAAEYRNVDRCLGWMQQHLSEQETTYSCLLVRVTLDEQQTSQAKQRKYWIRGWYLADVDGYRLNYGKAETVYLPGDSFGKPLSFEAKELETQLRGLIDCCLGNNWESPDSLQVFLPPELMDQPIDQWSVYALDPEEDSSLTFGVEHSAGVFIRCEERLTNRRIRRSDWEKRWHMQQQLPTEKCCELFLPVDENSCRSAERQFRDKRKRIFGLKLTCLPHAPEKGMAKQHGFFSVLSRSPIPAALWLRQSLEGQACENVVNEVLDSEQLGAIPEKIYDKRLDENDLAGQHLSLVWDDPHLLPPDFQRLPPA